MNLHFLQNNCKVCKLGMELYADGVDKNSGLFEFKIICNELKTLSDLTGVLVIVNGACSEQEKKEILNVIRWHREFYQNSKVIFIMSDSIALKTSLEIMNKCDMILHQAHDFVFEECKGVKQFYSYVPELFYKVWHKNNKPIKKPKGRAERVLFGGNNLNRQDKFDEYFLNDESICDVIKKDYKTGKDDRLNYHEYINLLKDYGFSLMICREDYRDNGWLTARLFECLAKDVVPIFDIDYDKKSLYSAQTLRCSNYKEMLEKVNMLNENLFIKTFILKCLQIEAEKNQNKFVELIQQIMKGI